MNIKILETNYKPTDIAVGSARSCYFGKNIVIYNIKSKKIIGL